MNVCNDLVYDSSSTTIHIKPLKASFLSWLLLFIAYSLPRVEGVRNCIVCKSFGVSHSIQLVTPQGGHSIALDRNEKPRAGDIEIRHY